MKRIQAWEPGEPAQGYRFVTEWDDEDPKAPHLCISATLNGEDLEDPQGVYEGVVASFQVEEG